MTPPKKILIAEDSHTQAMFLVSILESNGFEVIQAENGKEAIELCKHSKPDLVISDIRMPVMDGYEFCRQLKNDDELKAIPFIILTVLSLPEDIIAGLGCGADGFHVKPYSEKALINLANELLTGKVQPEIKIDNGSLIVQINNKAISIMADPEKILRFLINTYNIASSKSEAFEFTNRDLIKLNLNLERRVAERTAKLSKEIADKEKYQLALEESEKKYRLLYDNALVGMYTVTVDGKPISANNVTLSILGYSSQKEFLKTFNSTNHWANPYDRAIMISDLMKKGEVKNFQVQSLTTKGKKIWMEFSAKIDRNKNTIDVVAIDITERKRMEDTLNQRARQLQEQNEDLDAFSHTVAHDLKTPLNGILGFAQLIKDEVTGIPDSVIYNYINTVIGGGVKAQQIINSLLLFASVRKEEITPEKLNMGYIVAEATKRFTILIKESNAEIIFPDSWPSVVGFEPWIEEVWANYISNALKYGGNPPKIELGYDILKKDSKEMVRFYVVDNGLGISSENKKRLFKQFETLSNINTRGHGLGLSVVRRIIEKLGGEVGVKSKSGEGSLFYFTLPFS